MREIKSKFWDQRGNARKRGISFTLTFEEWWNIWQKSGHWDKRGRNIGQYCMSRYGDIGPYDVGNVFIQLTSKNTSDAQNGIKDISHTIEHNEKIRISMKGKNTGPKIKVKCPYCDISGAMHNMVRYHFDNCKYK